MISGKRAKQERKETAPLVADHVIVKQINICIFKSGKIQVMNFPENLWAAMDIIHTAKKAIIRHFIEKARAGELDENGNIKGSIIAKPPDRKIVLPHNVPVKGLRKIRDEDKG